VAKRKLEERLNGQPFVPFRINTADGKHFDVINPRLVVPMEMRVFIALGKNSWTLIALRHVTSLEGLAPAWILSPAYSNYIPSIVPPGN
jgi:hypothetical protein